MNQEWFEMPDIRRKSFNKSVWIPLRAVLHKESNGKYGYEGYKEDFFGSGSIAVSTKDLESAKKLEWMDIGISHDHSGYIDDGEYFQADVYLDYSSGFEGVHLVLEQTVNGEPSVWHLHQDLVITLGLKREGNSWVCPDDDYIEVARLKIIEDKPALLEIKAQYLKDYLCARGMSLYMTNFYSREIITSNDSFVNWEDGSRKVKYDDGWWEGRVIPIHEGGNPFGEKVAVFHMERTDIDESDDMPDLSSIPTDDNTKGSSWEKRFDGRKLFRIIGELWRNEIIEPSKLSPKVRGDEVVSSVYFIIDAEGSKICGNDLIETRKWLWFKPDVIMALSHRRGGSLSFYTQQTGAVGCSYGNNVHFGVNQLGYINVYAKDIGLLPEWQQQIWAGHNIAPEGGVSAELLASQVRANPADTQAPEEFLLSGIEEVNRLSHEKLGIYIFRSHEAIPAIIKKTHRFRAVDETSLYSLAKDLARLMADNLDANAMQSIVSPPKGTKWGSIKSLENLLASKYNRDFIREVMAALVGVYELRHADAHLPSGEIDNAFELIGIDKSQPYVHQGFYMLNAVVSSIYGIAEGLKRWPN